MNKVYNTFWAIAFSIAFGGCTEDIQIEQSSLPEGAIGFSGGVITRGEPIVNANGMLSMGVFCGITDGNFNTSTSPPDSYMKNVKVTRSSASYPFSYSPLVYWPLETTKKLSFFAYAPHNTTCLSFTTTGGTPKLTYTLPTTVGSQPDLMVGTPQKNKTKSDGVISFAMKHTLASIGFNISGQGETISSIQIKGIVTSATLPIDGSGAINWEYSSLPTEVVYTAGTTPNALATGSMTSIMNGDGYLMMIPQELGPKAKIIVTVDGIAKEVSLEGKTWEAGKKYMYDIKVGTSEVILVGMLGGWNGTEYSKLLQVESIKEVLDRKLAWGGSSATNATAKNDGAGNINKLKALSSNLSAYPAAKYCHDKGDGWYLPSQKQLIGIRIAYSGIPAKFSFTSDKSYWSSTEVVAGGSNITSLFTGNAGVGSKSIEYYVRCVKDVMPPTYHPNVIVTADDQVIIDNIDMPVGSITTQAKPRDMTGGIHTDETNKTVSHYFEVAKNDFSSYSAVSGNYWQGAINHCATQTIENKGEWRLPTHRELHLIAVLGEAIEAKNVASFNPLSTSGMYWSATNNWVVASDGSSQAGIPSSRLKIRCVRDVVAPSSKAVFTDDDRIIIDNRRMPAAEITTEKKPRKTVATNSTAVNSNSSDIASVENNKTVYHYLEVAKSDYGSGTDWKSAIDACAAIANSDGKGAWRLPTLKELKVIHSLKSEIEAKFGSFTSDNYWSATGMESSTSDSWAVNITSSSPVNYKGRINNYRVRCVRDIVLVYSTVTVTTDSRVIIDNRAMPAGQITTKRKARTTQGENSAATIDKTENDIASAASNATVYHYFEVAKSNNTANSWKGAIDGCAAMTNSDGKGAWRLPTQNELQVIYSLNDLMEAKSVPNFAKFISGSYWSATETFQNTCWSVNFDTGYAQSSHSKTNTLTQGRCVRDLDP